MNFLLENIYEMKNIKNYGTVEFPYSLELQYYLGSSQLDFGDRTGSSIFWQTWP